MDLEEDGIVMPSVYTITFGKELLRSIGAPYNLQTDLFLRAWSQAEGCMAKNNHFATTMPATGATNFNSVGVKNYYTWESGVASTAATLKLTKYTTFLATIRAGASANTMAVALANSPWGTGDLTMEVLKYRVWEPPFGSCYPYPPAPYAHGEGKIKPGSQGRDVDELLRCIARKRGVAGYKWYMGEVVDWVKRYQLARPWLWKPDGIVGPLTYKSICGHA
jgi:hypothetical protein